VDLFAALPLSVSHEILQAPLAREAVAEFVRKNVEYFHYAADVVEVTDNFVNDPFLNTQTVVDVDGGSLGFEVGHARLFRIE